MRRKPLILLLLAGMLALGAAAVPRAVYAYVCPACFGLERVAPRIYLEKGAPDSAAILRDVEQARARVATYYGDFSEQPVLLICATQACNRRLGGRGAKAITYGTRFIRVAPGGINPVILSHEFSHVLVHKRRGPWLPLPAWFDEGLAAVVSADPRYSPPCDTLAPLPDSARDWRREAGQKRSALYHSAACAVRDWIAAHGGKGAVLALLDGDLPDPILIGALR